jgi:phage gp36-like protein
MPRFIKESDYTVRVKSEIKKLLATNNPEADEEHKQFIAEDTAMATIREYIGGKYDCDAIFTPHTTGDTDTRNLHIVKCVIVLAIFDLYHQTGQKDIPDHRKMQYDDVIMWLKDVGRGTIQSTLPTLPIEQNPVEIRMNSKKQRTHRW